MATAAVKAGLKGMSGPPVPKDVRKVFDSFDKDGSGGLDRTEVRSAIKQLLKVKVDAAIFVSDEVLDHVMKGQQVCTISDFAALILELRTDSTRIVGSIRGAQQLPCQGAVHAFYRNNIVVQLVAFCIVSNFFVNILEKEIDPDPENLRFESFWVGADYAFNIIFVFELVANMWGYGGPVSEWWTGWNTFDTVIVTVGVLTMTPAIGPPLDRLKLMRAFRVFRLFRRIKPLNQIIVALIKSIPAVFYAFVVMFIFFCIYAILAVELFRDFGAGGHYYTYDEFGNQTAIDSETARGYIHGLEYYGTFMRALYTLFQVQTGESWSEAVARPLLFGLYRGSAVTVALYYVSFVILMQVVLVNVVVAVLLDSFASSPQGDDVDAFDSHVAAADADSGLGPAQSLPAPAAAPHAEGSSLSSPSPEALDQKLELIVKSLGKLDALATAVAELRGDVTEIKANMAKRASGSTGAVQQTV